MAGGRPTKYKPRYCKDIIDHMAKGKSLVQFAASIEVSKETVYAWARENKEFSDAFYIGRSKCEAFWEKIVQSKTIKKLPGSDGVLLFYMKNRFKWSENQKLDEIEDDKENQVKIVILPDNGRLDQ